MNVEKKTFEQYRIEMLERQIRIYRKVLDRKSDKTNLECNLCGFYGPFDSFGNRKRANARCPACSGLERLRLLVKALEHIRPSRLGDKVLELAPFKGTADYFTYWLGADFFGLDIDADKMIRRGIPCFQSDLCGLNFEELGHFDIIINIHVMEHLKCDPHDVIEQLTKQLNPGGVHIISVPFGGERTVEDLSDMEPDVRLRRFGHVEHYRSFGHIEFPAELSRRFGARFTEFDRTILKNPKNERHSLGLDMPANRLFVIRAATAS